MAGSSSVFNCAVTMLSVVATTRAFVRPAPAALVGCFGAGSQTRAKSTIATRMSLSDDDKLFYSLGAALAGQTDQFKKLLNPGEREVVLKGFSDHWLDKTLECDPSQYSQKVNTLLEKRNADFEKGMQEKSAGFLEAAAKEEGAVTTSSGLVIRTVQEGTGIAPTGKDTVKVHYHGTMVDGSVFDSSVMRGSPISFPLDGVIKGWTEGLQLMKVGGKAKLTIPPDLAYGERGTGPIPPDSTLVFEVELLAIE